MSRLSIDASEGIRVGAVVLESVLEMLNKALNLPDNFLLNMNIAAPNLLAPTGSDLNLYNPRTSSQASTRT